MGDTVEAIGYKADVPSRTKEAVSDRVQSVKDKVTGAAGRANEATPDAGDVKQGARKAVGIAQENPLGLAIGAVATGFLVGLLVPSTRIEDEKIGPLADQVKQQAKETGQEAVERGKQVAQEAAEAAKSTAQEQAQQQGSGLADSARQSAEQVRS